jgi:hypothetical protein
MWLTLAKLEPALLAAVRGTPGFPGTVLGGGGGEGGAVLTGPLGGGFRPETDRHGEDCRTLDQDAEGRAEVEEDAADWRTVYPALARATGQGPETGEQGAPEEQYGYGPAFVLSPDEVREVSEGLEREGWAPFLELGPFYAAAAKEGRAVVGAVI